MATEKKPEGIEEVNVSEVTVGFTGKIEAKYRELKENLETYPYVWASYTFVYGTLGLWYIYRWRKLRKTEDRVRALQERLRQIYQAEEAEEAARSTNSPPIKADKPPIAQAKETAINTSFPPTKADNSLIAQAEESASSTSSPPTKADKPPK